MRFKIFKFNKLTSTNDMAIKLIKEKKERSGYVHTTDQTKGKGTYGKKWISHKGNLLGSIFFPIKKNYPPFNEFTTINPVLIYSIIKKFCKNEKVVFKLLNDLFVNGKKICGILQEIISLNSKQYLIIGIGINLVSNPKVNSAYKTTSILKETKKSPSIKETIKLIILSYENFFKDLSSYNYNKFKKKLIKYT